MSLRRRQTSSRLRQKGCQWRPFGATPQRVHMQRSRNSIRDLTRECTLTRVISGSPSSKAHTSIKTMRGKSEWGQEISCECRVAISIGAAVTRRKALSSTRKRQGSSIASRQNRVSQWFAAKQNQKRRNPESRSFQGFFLPILVSEPTCTSSFFTRSVSVFCLPGRVRDRSHRTRRLRRERIFGRSRGFLKAQR